MGQRIAFKNTNGMYHAIRSLISYDEESQWSKKFGNCFCLMLTRLVKEYYARLAASVDRNAKESKQQTRELEANFHAFLTSEQQKVFEELMEQRVDATAREYINIFVEGFRMGAKLIIEVISDSK